MSCGEDAAFTKRLEANDKRIEVIGGSDKYMAVCRNCWHSNKEKGNFCSWPSSKKKIGNSRFFSKFFIEVLWPRSNNIVFDTQETKVSCDK